MAGLPLMRARPAGGQRQSKSSDIVEFVFGGVPVLFDVVLQKKQKQVATARDAPLKEICPHCPAQRPHRKAPLGRHQFVFSSSFPPTHPCQQEELYFDAQYGIDILRNHFIRV